MKKYGSATRETLKEAGYKYKKYLGNGQHLLRNSDGGLEVFVSGNLHFSGWGLIYKNTALEFVHSYKRG